MATERLKTIKPSGGDYTSLSAAEAGEDDLGDLVARDEWMHFSCYAMEDTTPIVVDGWTLNSAHYIQIDTPSGERHSGVWSDSKYRIVVADAIILEIKEGFVRLFGLQIKLSNPTYPRQVVYFSAGDQNGEYVLVGENIIVTANDFGHILLQLYHPSVSYTGNHYWFNNLLIMAVSNAQAMRSGDTASVFMYNNTIIGGGNAGHIGTYGGPTKAVNNLVISPYSSPFSQESGKEYVAGSGYNSTNVSAMGYTVTGGATGDRVSQTFSFVNAASGNYHLTRSDVGAKDFGASDPSGGIFSNDIDGQTRSGSWDIGADEHIPATWDATSGCTNVSGNEGWTWWTPQILFIT